MSSALVGKSIEESFRHEAAFYSGEAEFAERMTSFIREGLEAEEPVLVAVIPPKIDLLRSTLNGDADHVMFVDMSAVGRNPSRIIPVWHDFVNERAAADGRVRGIGEPIWAGRSPDELVESQRHESLINLAFTGAPAWILCPYDTDSLPPDVINEAYRSHPLVSARGQVVDSGMYRDLAEIAAPFDEPLAEPDGAPEIIAVEACRLSDLRDLVFGRAVMFDVDVNRAADLVLSVNELATNTLRHGGGRGMLRIWYQDDAIVCEVSDRGHIDEPLVGRRKPQGDERGMGLWIVNQLCDLVQLRSFDNGSVVRVHMSRKLPS